MSGNPHPSSPEGELTLRGLHVFIAVEETGLVAEAAKRIGASSSGFSQLITTHEVAVATNFSTGAHAQSVISPNKTI